jgi:hypothetical protein
MGQQYCDRIGLPATADEFIEEMQRRMTEVANRVDRQFPQNTAVTINAKGVPVLNKYNARVIPESAQRLHVEVIRRMPERSILDILVNVEHLTNFTKHFGPASQATRDSRGARGPRLFCVLRGILLLRAAAPG